VDRRLSRRVFAGAAALLALTAGRADCALAAYPGIDLPPTGAIVNLTANKQLVANATDAFFNQHDAAAVDRYVGTTYIQHSSLIGDGPEALRALIGSLDPAVRYENVRLLADGDLVAAHGRYVGFGETPLIAIDIFRIADGKLVEHWDGLQPEAAPNPSGHTALDGPTEIALPDTTVLSRVIGEAFVDDVLIGGQLDRLSELVSPESYTQHNPQIADGLDGLGTALAALAEQGIALTYNARHRTIAEGEFVLIQSDGAFGRPVVYYDLFRIENRQIVEHWDVIQDIIPNLPHQNGQF
jgi:predicted SnoaL-like aldol condensation-catalyzing enzyme